MDVIILILSVFAFIRGWKKGILWALASLVAVVVGSMVSLKMAQQFAQYLGEQNIINSRYTLLISYVVLFLVVMYGLRFIIKFIEKILDTFLLGWANKLAGGALYVLFTIFIISSVLWLGHKVEIIEKDAQQESQLYSFIEPIAPKGIELGGQAIPILKDLYKDVELNLDKFSEKHLPQE